MHNIRSLIVEHQEAYRMVAQIRELTDDFVPPPETRCNAWRALYAGLADFDKALDEHIALEDDVLFPRVMAAVRTSAR